MVEKIRDILKKRVLLADGGMSMELYSRGFFVNCCYDELNITSPAIIEEIHTQYAKSGAEIITANTFGANRLKLDDYGIADKLEEINRRGVAIARKIAGDNRYVAGSIGPVLRSGDSGKSDNYQDIIKEQASILLDAGIDLLILESFPSLELLKLSFDAVNSLNPAIPVLPSISYSYLQTDQEDALGAFLTTLKDWGAELGGISGGGVKDVLEMISKMKRPAGEILPLSVMPNACSQEMVDGRTIFMDSPEYLAEYTKRLVQKGVAMVGGNAGITPRMIREMSSFLRSVQPRNIVEIIEEPKEEHYGDKAMTPIPIAGRSPFGRSLGKKFVISVELDPPKGIDATKSVEGAKFLYEHGIDAVNIADGPRASGRMSPIALSQLVRRAVPIESVIHVCCRDRNLLALQMDLISSNALGLHNLMIITGDPPKMGIYPDATAVFDLDSIGLVDNVSLLNRGLDFAKRPLKGQTSFVIGVGCNPGATDIDLEVKRYEQKVNAGAEFVFSQPIYDIEILDNFLKRVKHVKPIPFFVGVLPLSSLKNAEFFNNNVPGMQVPAEIMKRIGMCSTKEKQREEGIKIAAESLRYSKKYEEVQGAYIYPPFGRYESILDVLELSGVW